MTVCVSDLEISDTLNEQGAVIILCRAVAFNSAPEETGFLLTQFSK